MIVDFTGMAALVTASVGVLGAIGAVGRFVWNKVERRFDEVDAELEKCRIRERRSDKRESTQLIVIELLWQEVRTHNPASMVLARAKRLLDQLQPERAFPVEPLPDEFQTLARKLDKGEAA